jgi:hypothetical protein
MFHRAENSALHLQLAPADWSNASEIRKVVAQVKY